MIALVKPLAHDEELCASLLEAFSASLSEGAMLMAQQYGHDNTGLLAGLEGFSTLLGQHAALLRTGTITAADLIADVRRSSRSGLRTVGIAVPEDH